MIDAVSMPWIHSPADERAYEAGCRFDAEAAERVRLFFARFLKHSKGSFAGQPFELLPWQWENVIGPAFGWKRPDGTRRFRRVSCWVSKKNGKTSLASALVLYMLMGDGEKGAEVYGAAADRQQASLVFTEAKNMVEQSVGLSDKLRVLETVHRITYGATRSFYSVLSKDSHKSGHGVNAHLSVVDELHVVDRKLYDTLLYAGAARRQPLFVEISTAGNDKTSLGYERYLYARKVRDGVTEDPDLLVYIAEADSNDVWEDPAQWRKANPSLGVTISEESFAADQRTAANGTPADIANFRQLRLDLWQDAVTAWLDLERWDACATAPTRLEDLRGRDCYAGLDLAATTDLAALVLLFPDHDGTWDLYPFFWVPEGIARQRERKNRSRLDGWIRQGLIDCCPGEVLDYERIRRKIQWVGETFWLKELAVDPWNASQLIVQMQADGVQVVAVRQGYASLSAPTKELEALILAGKVRHGGHPVLRWCAGNTSVEIDPAGNVKPSKKLSTDKIDGISATVTGLARAMLRPVPSYYEQHGVEFV